MSRYWLATFDEESWAIFLGLKPSTLGSKRELPDVAVGDIFLAYVKSSGARPGQWVSAERIVSGCQYDEREIYPAGIWPYRWPVEPAVSRRVFGEGLVGRDLIPQMRMFDHLSFRNWGGALRTPGREIPPPDGDLLMDLLA